MYVLRPIIFIFVKHKQSTVMYRN